MARVSVTVSQKPKPLNTFKYLRRDEGRLSYSCNPSEATTTPRHTSSGADQNQGVRQSLRSAIARDMKSRKMADPFDDVVVAVPRKAPPPHPSSGGSGAESSESPRYFTNTLDSGGEAQPPKLTEEAPSSLSSSLPRRKEEWVDVNASLMGRRGSRHAPLKSASPTAWRERVDDEKAQAPNAPTSGVGGGPTYPGGAAPFRDPPPPQNAYERWGGAEAPLQSSFGLSGAGSSGLGGGGGMTYSPNTEEAMHYGSRGGAGFQWEMGRSSSAPRRLEEEYGYGNYFHRHTRPHSVESGSRRVQSPNGGSGEEQIMLQLQRELDAAKFERQHFLGAKRQLEEEKKQFENFRTSAEAELAAAQSRLAVEKSEIKREPQKELRALEERYRATSTILEKERENNRRLVQENDLLHAQLDELTTTMRESQQAQKAEIARLRRDVDSLTHRNSELLAMARQQQIDALESSSSQSIQYSTSSTLRSSAENVGSSLKRSGTSSMNGVTGLLKNSLNRVEIQRINERSNRSNSSNEDGRGAGLGQRVDAVGRPHSEELRETAGAAAEESNSFEVSNGDNRSGNSHKSLGSVSKAVGASSKKKNSGNGKGSQGIPTKEDLLGPEDPIPPVDIPNDAVVSKTVLGKNSNKHKISYRSGKEEVKYSNGTTKIVLPSGHTILHFVNGDIMRTFPSGRRTYWYETAQTLHTQLPDGVELFEFLSTGQIERHLPSGEKNVLHPDGTYDVLRPDSADETVPSS